MKITGAQIRAARAFLDWTIRDLSAAAEVSESTIRSIEQHHGAIQITGGLEPTLEYRANAREASINKLADALTAAGITFLPESVQGVGLRGKHKGTL
jgi:ribosome-binding protein aMBF1 (putative translation factor)